MTPRALLSLLFHADKALDLLSAAYELGILARLDAGEATLAELAASARARPSRLYKFLDGLESLGLVEREQPRDELASARYRPVAPLVPAYEVVLGARSIERDRDRYPWRELYGRLPQVVAGSVDGRFAWPPTTPAEIAAFERSMALGCPPIIEALEKSRSAIFREGDRWIDIGGGDGTVAAAIVRDLPIRAAVLNLPSVAPLVREVAAREGVADRLEAIGADFLVEPLPLGYDVMSFIRVLHDWPAEVARQLLQKARDALTPGARIVICEEFRNPDRLAVQFFWTYFLVGVDACASRLREPAWYRDTLAALGFRDLEIHPGAFDVIVATRY